MHLTLVPPRSEGYLAQSCDSSCGHVRVVIVGADGHGEISRRPERPGQLQVDGRT